MLCPFCLGETPILDRTSSEGDRHYMCAICREAVPVVYVRDRASHLPIVLSIAGLAAHGKTTYLASLLMELERASEYWPGFHLGFVDETTFQDAISRVRTLQSGVLPLATPRMFPRPAMVRLSGVPGFGDAHLLMYDTGGEAFEEAVSTTKYAGYVARSPAVIWVVSLEDIQSPEQLVGALEVYMKGLGMAGGNSHAQTLIVALSKGDLLLRKHNLPSVVAEYLSEPTVSDSVEDAWARLDVLSGALENWLLDRHQYSAFVSLARGSFRDTKYCVVSTMSEQGHSTPQRIAVRPVGILGPLLWAMSVSDMALRPDKGLSGHKGAVTSVSFSTDGGRLISGGKDGAARLWDATSGEALRYLGGLGQQVWSTAFSHDDLLVAAGGSDRFIAVWDTRTGVMSHRLRGFTRSVCSLAFSPCERLLAGGCSDDRVYLWKVGSDLPVRVLAGHSDTVDGVAFSPDGSLVVSGSHDRTVRIWRSHDGGLQRTLIGHEKEVRTVAFSADGHLVVSGDEGGEIRVWDAGTGVVRHRLRGHVRRVEYVCCPREGALLVSEGPQELRLWNIRSGRLLRSKTNHGGGIQCVAVSPNGQVLASVAGRETIQLWRIS